MKNKTHILPLTSLRFFAAIHVVLFHTVGIFFPTWQPPSFIGNFISIGYIGVSLFFVLSGYILTYIYISDDKQSKLNKKKFWWARFARIYPLYLFSLLIQSPFILAHRLLVDSASTAVLKFVLSAGANLAMVQAWLPPLRGGWNGPGWSLSAEAFFYLAFPFVAPLLWNLSLRSTFYVYVILLLAGLLLTACVVVLLGGGISDADAFAYQDYVKYSPLLRLPEFLMGVLLAKALWWLRRRYELKDVGRAGAFLSTGALAGIILVISSCDRVPFILLHNGLLTPLFSLLIVGMTVGAGPVEKILSFKPIVLLGEASYAVYLLHIPLLYWFSYYTIDAQQLYDSPSRYGVNQPTLFGGYLLLLVTASIAVYKLIENPMRVGIKNWLYRQHTTRDLYFTERSV